MRLNQILQTRNSARGLIVSMSDVLFDSGTFLLNLGARVKLAKVAGILMSYPTLNTEVGGHTDNVGNDDTDLTLSQNRAVTVRDYLVNQGLAAGSVSARASATGPRSRRTTIPAAARATVASNW